MSKKYDLIFIISLVFLVVIGIHLVNHYLQKQDLEEYLDLLGSKISEMIPDSEKTEFDGIYGAFLKQIEDEEVPLEEVEELASRIVELRKVEQSISAVKVKEILQISKINAPVSTVTNGLPKIKMEGKWKQLAKEFETEFLKSDSIRLVTIHHAEIKQKIEKQLKIHTEIAQQMESMHEFSIAKIEKLKDEISDKKVQKELKKEMDLIKSANLNLNHKILAIEELKKVIANEKQKLQTELKKINSTQPSH